MNNEKIETSEYITREEFEQFKKLYYQQFNSIGSQIIALKEQMVTISPKTPITPVAREILVRNFDRMYRDVEFLKQQFNKFGVKK
jgi:hypothetical protein